ncbi:MAG: M56 family metallopeptidase, partial [Acidobacteriota bacterium]|nr:M56 family metallopeptidase [Acidobacteriota bacterium]
MLHQPLWLSDLAAYSFQAGAIIIVGSLLPPLLRLRVPKVRLVYWQALLAACLLLPLIEPWKEALAPMDGTSGEVSVSVGTGAVTGARWPFSLAEVILAVLLAGFLFRAVWIMLGLRRLRLYRMRAELPSWAQSPIDEARDLVGVSARILLSRDLKSPATFGLRSPVVLLPVLFFQLPCMQQRAIACHEYLHVARRDWAWTIFEEFILTALWFHPALWWAVRNIRTSREQTVDAEVVAMTQSKKAYLAALLAMAQQDLRGSGVPAPPFLREGQLAGRVSLMVKEVSMSRFRLVLACSVAIAALLLTGAVSEWSFPLRAPAKTPLGVTAEIGLNGASSGGRETALQSPAPAKVVIHVGPIHQVDVNKLKRVHVYMPPYPIKAKKAGIQGKVWLDVTVNSNGEVTVVKVISGPTALVKSAVDAVKQWRYAPSPLLPCRTKILITYTLSKSHVKAATHTGKQADPPALSTSATGPTASAKSPEQWRIYKPGGDVAPPRPIDTRNPRYTREARMAKLSGDLVLAVVVNNEGRVVSIKEVSKPLGKGLDDSALKTVSAWKFKPAERDG